MGGTADMSLGGAHAPVAADGTVAGELYEVDFGAGPVEARRHVNPDGSAGGWVAETANVDPAAWVDPDACVFGNARVFGTAQIQDLAHVCDNAKVDGGLVYGEATVGGDCTVADAEVGEQAVVVGRARVGGGAQVHGRARVGGDARILGPALIHGEAQIRGQAWISGGEIAGSVLLDGKAVVKPGTMLVTGEALYEAPAELWAVS